MEEQNSKIEGKLIEFDPWVFEIIDDKLSIKISSSLEKDEEESEEKE
jgi:hypothetical protein